MPTGWHWQAPTPSAPRQVWTPTQAIVLRRLMWQPFGSLSQPDWCRASTQNVPMPVPAWAAVQVLSQLQACPRPAPLHDWFMAQDELSAASEKRQLFASTWQSDWVDALVQKVPEPVQLAGAGLQAQAALPAAPPQVWCAPQAAWVVWTVTQPCASATQVVTALPSQYVPAPCEQMAGAALHVQLAAPAAPVQVSFAVHVVEGAALRKRQFFTSVEHIETLPPSQNGPAVVQVVGLHAHRPVVPSQVWCVPQMVVPLLKRHWSLSFTQLTDAPLRRALPTAEQLESVTQPQAPTPGLPVQAW